METKDMSRTLKNQSDEFSDWNRKLSDFETEFNNVAYESQRLLNPRAIGGKENVPIASGKQTLSRRQRNAATRSQDMQFVTDIGQQLLVECRKLQMLVADKDEKLKESDAIRAQLEATIDNLESRVHQLDESEERYREENWNLELRLQEIESEKLKDSDRWSKLNMENSKTLQLYTSQIEALELAQVRENELTSELEFWKNKFESELTNSEQLTANLREENYALATTVSTLNDQLASLQFTERPEIVDHDDDDLNEDLNSDDLSEDPKTPERSPPMSPVKATPAHRAGLEGETLKASLNHAHRIISNLRGAVHREKTEKMDLRRLLEEAQKELEALRSSKSVRRSKAPTALSTKRTTLLGTSGHRSQYRISTDLDDPEGDVDWEGFNGENNAFVSSVESTGDTDGFETALDHPTSDEDLSDVTETDTYHTGAESVVLSSYLSGQSDAELSLSEGEPISPVGPMHALRSKTSGRNLYHKRDSGNFGTPQPLFNELGSSPFGANQATPTRPQKVEVKDAESMTVPWLPETIYIDRHIPITLDSISDAAASLSMVALTKEAYDAMKVRNVTRDTVTEDAASLDMIAIPTSQYESITAPVAPTLESLEADASSLGMIVVSDEEYRNFVAPLTTDKVVELAQTLSMTAIPESVYSELVAPPTIEKIAADAAALSMTVVPETEYNELRAPPTAEKIMTAAAGLSMVVLPEGEYRELVAPPTPESVRAEAATLSMVVIPEGEYRELVAPPTMEKITADAAALSMTVVPETEYNELRAPPTAEKIMTAAAGLSMVVLPEGEYRELVAPPTPESVRAEAATFSMVVIPEGEYRELVTPTSSEKLKAEAAALSMAVIPLDEYNELRAPATAEKIKSVASGLSMVVLSEGEYLELAAPPTLESIKAEAATFSMVVIPEGEYRELVAPTSSEKLEAEAAALSMTVIPLDEYRHLRASVTTAAVVATVAATTTATKAAATALLSKPTEDYNASIAPPRTVDEAQKVDINLIPQENDDRWATLETVEVPMKVQSTGVDKQSKVDSVTASTAALPTTVIPTKDSNSLPISQTADTLDTIREGAQRFGMVVVSEEEYVRLTKPITVETVAEDAEKLSMIAIPREEYSAMTAPQTLDAVREEAQSFGMTVIPEEDYIRLTAPATKESVTAEAEKLSMIVITPDEYSLLANREVTRETVSADASALNMVAIDASTYDMLVDQSQQMWSPGEETGGMDHTNRDYTSGVASSKETSMYDNEMSHTAPLTARANDTSSQEGLSSENYHSGKLAPASPQILSAITQTMVGEFLWKYTRKRGRQVMSENRHKRYFWVHPYTRTLYWSAKNPSEGGEVKVKSEQIVSVKVLHDDNPFPPGLHHKSLVIQTPSRVLQLSCLTQERFEVWYNALEFIALRTNSIPNVISKVESNPAQISQSSSLGSHGLDFRKANALSSSRYANIPRSGTQGSMSSYNSRTMSSLHSHGRLRSSYMPQSFRVANQGSMGRLTSLLRPPTGTFNSEISRDGIYEAHEAIDSTEELRAQIEREEQTMEGLENVRVCCDGKHDVSTLSHRGFH